jgi:hypothetical protein
MKDSERAPEVSKTTRFAKEVHGNQMLAKDNLNNGWKTTVGKQWFENNGSNQQGTRTTIL